MSTGCECDFIEVDPGRWYYVLEHTHAPKNAWDWRDNASCYGPFTSFEIANQHLQRHHPNPGGHSVQEHVPGFTPDEVLADLLAAATL